MDDSFDLISILNIFFKHFKLILFFSILSAVAAYAFADRVIPKKYTSSVQLYVENKSASTDQLSSSDITVAQQLVDTCSIIFTSDSVIDQLADDSNIDYDAEELSDMILVGAVNNTEIMRITITTDEASKSQYIATKMRDICISEYERVISTGTITAVDKPKESSKPSSPNAVNYAILGFIAGFAIIYIIMVARQFLDTRVRPDDNLAAIYDIPVFAEIMDFENKNTNSYSASYGKNY